jgi:membrane protein YdbS with pleckstrin-like domain
MSTTPLFRYTPKFYFWRFALPRLRFCLFALVWGTGFLGGMLLCLLSFVIYVTHSFKEELEILPVVVFPLTAILILITLVTIFGIEGSKRFKQTEFLFFEDKFTWKSKGLKLDEGTVYYKEINAIETRTSMLQSCYSLGNLYLSLSAQGNQPNTDNTRSLKNLYLRLSLPVDQTNVLCLFDLPNAQEAFEQVVNVIHRSNTGSK